MKKSGKKKKKKRNNEVNGQEILKVIDCQNIGATG
jgi:hypothetical protein